jgi:cation:H+ antiporter
MRSPIIRFLMDEAILPQFMTGLPSIVLILIMIILLAVLYKGADFLVDGVVDLAHHTRVPQIVIGATIVSLATTTPEAFVSVMAAFLGNPGLALGNGVGSIIADTGLIFGLTAFLSNVSVDRFILNRTGWVQVGSATFVVMLAVGALWGSPENPVLNRWVGAVLIILLIFYLYGTYRWARQSEALASKEKNEFIQTTTTWPGLWYKICGGLVLMILAARVLIPAARQMAIRIGVPDDVIAATMVAFGTSLPELTAAIAAIKKGHPDITLGNVLGADVLNSLFVIGAAASARSLSIPPNFYIYHFPAMLIILWSFRFFASFNRNGWFKPWQGLWLLGIYMIYIILQYI